MRQRQLRQGFTLLETLIVLSIISLSLILTVRYQKKSQDEIEAGLFLQELVTHLESAQCFAVVTNKAVSVDMSNDYYIWFRVADGQETAIEEKLYLPDNLTKDQDKMKYILPSTGYLAPDTITFKTDQYVYKIIIQLGVGRNRIEKYHR